MRGRRIIARALNASLTVSAVAISVLLVSAGAASAEDGAPTRRDGEDAARLTYNNKMALIGVLRDSARRRAVVDGDLQTLCLVLGIGLDVTDRYLEQTAKDGVLTQRRNLMASDLAICRKALDTGISAMQPPR